MDFASIKTNFQSAKAGIKTALTTGGVKIQNPFKKQLKPDQIKSEIGKIALNMMATTPAYDSAKKTKAHDLGMSSNTTTTSRQDVLKEFGKMCKASTAEDQLSSISDVRLSSALRGNSLNTAEHLKHLLEHKGPTSTEDRLLVAAVFLDRAINSKGQDYNGPTAGDVKTALSNATNNANFYGGIDKLQQAGEKTAIAIAKQHGFSTDE